MNEFFNTLQKEARTLRLSTEEKQAMRVYVYKVMDAPPIFSAAQKSAVEEFKNRKSTPSMYNWLQPRFMVPLAVLLVTGLSGGTAFAAQSALPGEPLYTVKTQINEKVAVALATTPQAKAQVNASIATTRLEEAESLAVAGKLNATTSAELASNFAQHATEADANTVVVAAADPGSAAQLATSFNSTLSAHVAILAQLGSDAASTSVQESSDALALQVLTQAAQEHHDDASQGSEDVTLALATAPVSGDSGNTSAIMQASVSDDTASSSTGTAPAATLRVSATIAPVTLGVEVGGDISTSSSTTEEPKATTRVGTMLPHVTPSAGGQTNTMLAGHGSADDGVVAIALATQASSTLLQVQADFDALKAALDASTTAQIQTQIDAAGTLFTQGSAALESQDNAAAKDAFTKVLRLSVRLDAFLKAGKKFNVSFLTALLK